MRYRITRFRASARTLRPAWGSRRPSSPVADPAVSRRSTERPNLGFRV